MDFTVDQRGSEYTARVSGRSEPSCTAPGPVQALAGLVRKINEAAKEKNNARIG